MPYQQIVSAQRTQRQSLKPAEAGFGIEPDGLPSGGPRPAREHSSEGHLENHIQAAGALARWMA